MNGYILKRSDFSLRAYHPVTAYSLFSESGDSGKATMIDATGEDISGDWLYVDGGLYLISKCTPKNGLSELSLLDAAYAFNRDIIYTGQSAQTIAGFISSVLTSEYKQSADVAYRMPYLSIAGSGTKAFIAPELGNGNLFKLSDYIESARAEGVNVRFTYSGSTLAVTLSEAHTNRFIILGDGKNQLKSESYSRSVTAKVTVRKANEVAEGEEQTYTDYTYYLDTAGNLSSTVPQNRAAGEWKIITCGKNDIPLDKAKAIIAKNTQSHKIELYSALTAEVGDPITIRFESGKIVNTTVSAVGHAHNDDRLLIICGTMPTTLTEQLKRRNEQ